MKEYRFNVSMGVVKTTCITVAKTEEEARQNARNCCALHGYKFGGLVTQQNPPWAEIMVTP